MGMSVHEYKNDWLFVQRSGTLYNAKVGNTGRDKTIMKRILPVLFLLASSRLLAQPVIPDIAVQPSGLEAPVGTNVSFSVVATNYPPFSYQWYTSSGRTATAYATLGPGNRVQYVFMDDVGQGYTAAPQVQFVGGGGSGATGIAFLTGGSVSGINVSNPGMGYSTPPAVEIAPPTPVVNTPLPGQTNADLSLQSVTIANSTNLFVVVTNAYGSVTSSVVLLFVYLPPQNLTATLNGKSLLVQFTGSPNTFYLLQSTTNLMAPNWQNGVPVNPNSNGNCAVTITNLSAPAVYYRAVWN